MPKILATIERTVEDLEQVHKPDNGMMAAALEISTLNFLVAELKLIKEGGDKGNYKIAPGINHIEDTHVVGNADKMLFFTKQLAASAHDPKAALNPFVAGKLEVADVNKFDFTPFMGYIDPGASAKPEEEVKRPAQIES